MEHGKRRGRFLSGSDFGVAGQHIPIVMGMAVDGENPQNRRLVWGFEPSIGFLVLFGIPPIGVFMSSHEALWNFPWFILEGAAKAFRQAKSSEEATPPDPEGGSTPKKCPTKTRKTGGGGGGRGGRETGPVRMKKFTTTRRPFRSRNGPQTVGHFEAMDDFERELEEATRSAGTRQGRP